MLTFQLHTTTFWHNSYPQTYIGLLALAEVCALWVSFEFWMSCLQHVSTRLVRVVHCRHENSASLVNIAPTEEFESLTTFTFNTYWTSTHTQKKKNELKFPFNLVLMDNVVPQGIRRSLSLTDKWVSVNTCCILWNTSVRSGTQPEVVVIGTKSTKIWRLH